MSSRARNRILLVLLTLWSAALLLPGQRWGLPSRETDRFLFGEETPWSARKIQEAGGAWSPSTGAADADTSPLAATTRPTVLNDTPAKQAQIIRRYRLFSHQPDEMLTFMALAGMKGGHYDPRMYQYGGLWFYPVGALLKIAPVTLKSDMGYYLDHPEDFGKFYTVARLYSAMWGIVGTWVIFSLARRVFAGRLLLAATAAALFPLLPVVMNGAHEAKPHLAGAVLVLLTVLMAVKRHETGKFKWSVAAGVVAGLATGMVLSAAVALLVLPVMCWMGKGRRWLHAMTVLLLALLTYCATNPYVPINLLRNPSIVRDNLGALAHAKAISGQSNNLPAAVNGLRLIAEATAWPTAIVGAAALFFACAVIVQNRKPNRLAVLLALPTLANLIQFFTLAGGKNAEFARFAILTAVALALLSVWLVTQIRHRIAQRIACAELILVAAIFGVAYLMAFINDTTGGTRVTAAQALDRLGGGTLVVYAEPAPYSMPPVNLSKWKIVLAAPGTDCLDIADAAVYPVDSPAGSGPLAGKPFVRQVIAPKTGWVATRITWADKTFEILIREGRNPPAAH